MPILSPEHLQFPITRDQSVAYPYDPRFRGSLFLGPRIGPSLDLKDLTAEWPQFCPFRKTLGPLQQLVDSGALHRKYAEPHVSDGAASPRIARPAIPLTRFPLWQCFAVLGKLFILRDPVESLRPRVRPSRHPCCKGTAQLGWRRYLARLKANRAKDSHCRFRATRVPAITTPRPTP